MLSRIVSLVYATAVGKWLYHIGDLALDDWKGCILLLELICCVAGPHSENGEMHVEQHSQSDTSGGAKRANHCFMIPVEKREPPNLL